MQCDHLTQRGVLRSPNSQLKPPQPSFPFPFSNLRSPPSKQQPVSGRPRVLRPVLPHPARWRLAPGRETKQKGVLGISRLPTLVSALSSSSSPIIPISQKPRSHTISSFFLSFILSSSKKILLNLKFLPSFSQSNLFPPSPFLAGLSNLRKTHPEGEVPACQLGPKRANAAPQGYPWGRTRERERGWGKEFPPPPGGRALGEEKELRDLDWGVPAGGGVGWGVVKPPPPATTRKGNKPPDGTEPCGEIQSGGGGTFFSISCFKIIGLRPSFPFPTHHLLPNLPSTPHITNPFRTPSLSPSPSSFPHKIP